MAGAAARVIAVRVAEVVAAGVAVLVACAAAALPAQAGSPEQAGSSGARPQATADGPPRFAAVKAAWRPSDTLLLDRHGQPLQVLRTDDRARRLDWVPLNDISPALRRAVLASEDRRFADHHGVDWAAAAGAAFGLLNTGGQGRGGASTLTMQLAGLLDTDLATPKGGRSVSAKLAQAAAAWRIEQHWRKDEILEAYLNLVPFRGEQIGVAAMSRALFQKAPSGLNLEESAIAAALLRAPNAAPALVGQRACGVLKALGQAAPCDAVQGRAALVLAVSADAGAGAANPSAPLADAQLAPHAARQALAEWRRQTGALRGVQGAENGALKGEAKGTLQGAASAEPPARLATTLDAGLQGLARDTLRQQIAELQSRGVEDGAVIVLDNASGDVLAWVGSSGPASQAAQVDAVVALRQAGSALKPFLYEQAIEARWLTAASVLDDAPTRLQTGAGLYIPQNYDHAFKGPVSVRTALGASLNVPAVRTLVMVTPDRFARRLVALGLPLKHPGDHYGYSLALGSAEVSLLTLANAYRSLANGGLWGPTRLLAGDGARPVAPSGANPAPNSAASRRVMDAAASFIVADMLADDAARVPTFGLGSVLATPYPAAVKTGTSKDMRDNWCVGFSRRYTVGVWVGNANGAPMHDVSGVSGAAPVWRAVMDALQRGRADVPFAAPFAEPPGVQLQPVEFQAALEPPRSEWFLPGTAMPRVALASAGGGAARRIVSPEDGSVLALDPDMPPAAQRLHFAAVADVAPAGATWRLDGRPFGPARPLDWPLWPGRHRLALVGADGRVLDEVRFEVRGARATAGSAAGTAPHGSRTARTEAEP